MNADKPLVLIGCGALMREAAAIVRKQGWSNVKLSALSPELHNRPGLIPDAVRNRVREVRNRGYRATVLYGDCGTCGALDDVCNEQSVKRMPGLHCYELYVGRAAFAALCEREPGTFFLTDFLARHFDRLVWLGLQLDRSTQLVHRIFGRYRRLIYLAQTDDPRLLECAREAATRLKLEFELRPTGYGKLARFIAARVTEAEQEPARRGGGA